MFCSQLNFHALTFLYPALTISSRVGRKLKAKSLRLVLFLYLSHWWKGRFPLDLPWNRAIVANPQEESTELASTSGCHAPWLSPTWCGWCWRVEGQWTIPWKRLECQCDPESHGLFFFIFWVSQGRKSGKEAASMVRFFPCSSRHEKWRGMIWVNWQRNRGGVDPLPCICWCERQGAASNNPNLTFPSLRNSGKTFGALQDLLAAPSGLYMAPLRLLAWEIYEKMGKAAALVKGLPILNPSQYQLLAISVAFPCGKEALRSQSMSMYLCYVFPLIVLIVIMMMIMMQGTFFPWIMMMILMQVIMMMVIMMFAAAADDDDDDDNNDDTELGSRFHGQDELSNIPGFFEI